MNKKLLITNCLAAIVAFTFAQAPHETGTYYAKAHGKCGEELKNALFDIIKNVVGSAGIFSFTGFRHIVVAKGGREL